MLKPLTVWITTNCGKLLDGNNRLPYLCREKHVCRLRNNKPNMGTADWFKIGKGVRQDCILSPCLFNLCSECCAAELSRSVMPYSLQSHGLYPTRLICPWGFSRQEYWSGLPCRHPGDLSNPGIEPRSPHCRRILYHLSHQWSSCILEWIAYSFTRESAQPKNWTEISFIVGEFFTNCNAKCETSWSWNQDCQGKYQ